MVDIKITPKARVPALAKVFIPKCRAVSNSPLIVASIVQYIPPPGTNGNKAQIIKEVTGVLKILAKISLYVLNTKAEINNEETSLRPRDSGKEQQYQLSPPPKAAKISFLPLY